MKFEKIQEIKIYFKECKYFKMEDILTARFLLRKYVSQLIEQKGWIDLKAENAFNRGKNKSALNYYFKLIAEVFAKGLDNGNGQVNVSKLFRKNVLKEKISIYGQIKFIQRAPKSQGRTKRH